MIMARAAVASVILEIQRLHQHHSQSGIPFPQEISSVYEHLLALESFLIELHRGGDQPRSSGLRVNDLEQPIEDAVGRLEDLIEPYVSSIAESETCGNQIRNYALAVNSQSQQLLKVTAEDIINLTERVKNKEWNNYVEEDLQPINYATADHAGDCKATVGLNDEFRHLMNWLVFGESEGHKIRAVTGMAGIGKTTLVQQVFYHEYICHHFAIREMVTIGPFLQLRDILLLLLDRLGSRNEETFKDMVDDKLASYLECILRGRRYLIVLDDVWNSDQFEDMIAPLSGERHKRGRIILTSRMLNILTVSGFRLSTRILEKRFLNGEESWELLRQTVFTSSTRECCSWELEKIGKEIANKCEGLPLAIISMGQLLCKVEKTVENWKKVLEEENPLDIRKDGNSLISKSLFLSYELLPQHLKACFLYMGVFPQGYEISVDKLFRLWVAEGFILQESKLDFYEMVEESVVLVNTRSELDLFKIVVNYLFQLCFKSVVLANTQRSGVIQLKTFRVHFVFRTLCVSEAHRENFCHVIKKYPNSFPLNGMVMQQRLCIHNNVVLGFKQVRDSMKLPSSTRSLLYFGPQHLYPLQVYLGFRLLKVLDALSIRFYEFPNQVLKLARLRHLALTYDGKLPHSISSLRNLEFLIVGRHQCVKSTDNPKYLPVEIWDLQWLRHLDCIGTDLPDPCEDANECDDNRLILKFLYRLSGVSARSCKPGVLARMPKLRRLGVRIELAHDEVETFNFLNDVSQQLHLLESFKYCVLGLNTRAVPPKPCFPHTLRKLSLSGCGFPWEYMIAVSSLKNLAKLKLKQYAFRGPVWVLHKLDFPRLTVLLLEDMDLEEWIMELPSFPNLRCLDIRHCYKLRKIPREIGEINNLKYIEVEDCSSSLVTSAKQIREDRRSIASDDLLAVNIICSWEDGNKRKSSS